MKRIGFMSAVVCALSLQAMGCMPNTLNEGQVGLVLNWGKLDGGIHTAGLVWVNVLTESLKIESTQVQHIKATAATSSSDLQQVTTSIDVEVQLTPPAWTSVYQQIGSMDNFLTGIGENAVQEALKAVTAKFTAEDLVKKREEAKAQVVKGIEIYVKASLVKAGVVENAIRVNNVAMRDFEFTKDFNASIEAKVKAEQEALQAENTKKKTITDAEAKADALNKQTEADANQIKQLSIERAAAIKREADALASNPNLVKLRAVEKWNGVLPTYSGTGNAMPFLDVSKVSQ